LQQLRTHLSQDWKHFGFCFCSLIFLSSLGFPLFALVANMVGLIIIAVFVRSENVHVMLWPIVQIYLF
jgi:hypothetical protein